MECRQSVLRASSWAVSFQQSQPGRNDGGSPAFAHSLKIDALIKSLLLGSFPSKGQWRLMRPIWGPDKPLDPAREARDGELGGYAATSLDQQSANLVYFHVMMALSPSLPTDYLARLIVKARAGLQAQEPAFDQISGPPGRRHVVWEGCRTAR